MITVYTGNGKGKTTSALGDAVLALCRGKKPILIQFMKGSSYSGELVILAHLKVPLIQFGVGCIWSAMIRTGLKNCTGCGECFRMNRDPKIALPLAQEALTYIKNLMTEKEYDFIILDEISYVLQKEFITMDQLLPLLKRSSYSLDWVLTGRGMPEELHSIVNSWNVLYEKKHPYHEGIHSRRGIEY